MDSDLEELLRTFSGYGVESWMKDSLRDMTRKVQTLRDAIRKHRDERGHDRCWLDDQELYKVLPEGLKGDSTLPPKEEFIANCHRYWEHRQDPTVTFIRQKDLDDDKRAHLEHCLRTYEDPKEREDIRDALEELSKEEGKT